MLERYLVFVMSDKIWINKNNMNQLNFIFDNKKI